MDQDGIRNLNGSVYARVGVSGISGVGIIAIRDIPAGTEFESTGGYVSFDFTVEEFRALDPDIRSLILDQTLQDREGRVSFYHPNLMIHSFMNHSRNPNTDGVRTIRNVKKGEELTKDYRLQEGLSSMSRLHMGDFL